MKRPRKSCSSTIACALICLSACGGRPSSPPSTATTTAREAPKKSEPEVFRVAYREPASIFETMDNVSMWSSGKCDEEYRDYWQKRFGVSDADEKRFAEYKVIRKRYYDYGPTNDAPAEPNLFAPAKPADRVAHAFYAAATLADAYRTLGTFMKPEDVAAVQRYLESYASSYAALLAESAPFREMATTLQSKLDSADASTYARRVATFYGVTDVPRMEVLFVWWPPVENTSASVREPYVLLKVHPLQHAKSAAESIDIPIHELVHSISARQSEAQKRALTKAFLAGCDVTANLPTPKILEEPLAVVHQKIFLSESEPARFDRSASWYGGDPWIGTFAKLIFDRVRDARDAGRPIDEALMTGAAKTCSQLKRLGAVFDPARAK